MYEAVMMAATGVYHQQRRLDTIADNIANTNTVGFKRARFDFRDALYTAGLGPAETPEGNQQKGHGVMLAGITKEFDTGSMLETGNPLDFAIEGEGFLEVVDNGGRRLYTRSGAFSLTNSGAGGQPLLVNGQGFLVQNDRGGNIVIPEGTDSIQVSESGQITFYSGIQELGTEQFGMYTFTNKTGLSYAGLSNYEITPAAGNMVNAAGARIRQGCLESSNVDMATEMTRMIRAQRAMSLASRALTTADSMEGIANSLRK